MKRLLSLHSSRPHPQDEPDQAPHDTPNQVPPDPPQPSTPHPSLGSSNSPPSTSRTATSETMPTDNTAPSPPPSARSTHFHRIPRSVPQPPASLPISGAFPSHRFVIGGGVAIFHLASARVVLCRHSADKYWFLPKGRRDAGEASNAGAEREGFEESGYRNRLLPVPLETRQPLPHNVAAEAVSPFVTDPLVMEMAPVRDRSQYVLFWYVAETVPPGVEAGLNQRMEEAATRENQTPYLAPERWPEGLTLGERLGMEEEGYEPVHHQNTAVDAEEALYESYLLPVEEAVWKLRWTLLQHEVVRRGWNAICARWEFEAQAVGGE